MKARKTLAAIQNSSFYEVQDYAIRTEHLRAWVYIAMGLEQFNALPADLQQVVVDGKEMQKYEHEIFLKNEEELESSWLRKAWNSWTWTRRHSQTP